MIKTVINFSNSTDCTFLIEFSSQKLATYIISDWIQLIKIMIFAVDFENIHLNVVEICYTILAYW